MNTPIVDSGHRPALIAASRHVDLSLML